MAFVKVIQIMIFVDILHPSVTAKHLFFPNQQPMVLKLVCFVGVSDRMVGGTFTVVF